MTDMTWGSADSASFGVVRSARRRVPRSVLCAAALLFSAPLGFALLYLRPAAPPEPKVAAAPAPKPARMPPAAIAPLRHYAALLDPSFIAGTKPASFVQPAALRAAFEPRRMAVPDDQPMPDAAQAARQASDDQVAMAEPADTAVVPALPSVPPLVQDVPLPTPRPDFADRPARPHAASRQLASAMPETPAPVAPGAPTAPTAPAPASQPSFFDRLFAPLQRPGGALGYAAVEPGAIGTPGMVDRYTAVYDISAHTVILPNGSRLEAHSGLGAAVDDPSSVTQRMRGATPPNLYELTPREALFHGVRALRMTPTGGTTYGRAGLLTHSYMLRGRSGESNGCVVFRDYSAFLAAYDSGQIRRLLVVAHAS